MKSLINQIRIGLILLATAAYWPNMTGQQVSPSLAALLMPQYVPPSPTSQVFQRYMGYPPDLSTGAVNISIPLYSFATNGFSIPFTLNYQTSGIKVHDTEYPLGYGWALYPGLRITRTVLGWPDDKFPYKNIKDENYLYNSRNIEGFYYIRSLINKSYRYEEDSQYDVFTLSLPSGSVSFLLRWINNSWQTVLIGSPLKIKVTSVRNFSEFEVTDEQGVRYFFGGTDKYIEYAPRAGCNTAWLLQKIVLPGQSNSIDLTWEKSNNPWTNKFNETFTIVDDGASKASFVQAEAPSSSQSVSYQAPDDFVDNKVLTKIQSASGKIEFTYLSNYLNSMKVYNPSGILVKNVEFTVNDHLLKEASVGAEKYKFEYDPTRFQFTRGQDYWGYYNAIPNQTMYPKILFNMHQVSGTITREEYGSALKTVDSIAMKANMLIKITYPTGGFTSYTYEPHKFNGTTLKQGGGLRVTSMTSRLDATSTPITTTYKYGSGESGLGECTIEPTLSTFVQEQYVSQTETHPGPAYTFRQRTILPYSTALSYLAFTLPVWYKEVTEYTGEGKIVRRFDYKPDEKYPLYASATRNVMKIEGLVLQEHPLWVISKYRNVFQQGARMTGQSVFKKNGSAYGVVEKDTFMYTDYNFGESLQGIHLNRYISYAGFPNDGTYQSFSLYFDERPYIYKYSEIELVKHKLTTTSKESYSNGSFINNTFTYIYNTSQLYNLSSETQSNSQGQILKKEYLYPQDNLSELTSEQKQFASDMVTANMITTPLLVKTSNNNTPVKTEISKYYNWGNNLILPQKFFIQYGNNIQENRTTYHNYDSRGNIMYLSKDAADKVVYLWSYNYQYPVIKVEGASYEEVKAALGNTVDVKIDLFGADNPSDSEIEAKGADIRRYFSGKPVLVTTYTYQPLVGITSMTDPAGVKTTYKYDGFGRLETILDKDGKIIEHYRYKYQQ